MRPAFVIYQYNIENPAVYEFEVSGDHNKRNQNIDSDCDSCNCEKKTRYLSRNEKNKNSRLIIEE